MNPIEEDIATRIGAWFDVELAPYAEARRRAGAVPYFPVAPDPVAASYFSTPSVASMTMSDFEFPGGGNPEGLIDALVAHWASEGETVLARSGHHLRAISAQLAATASADTGDVDIFCYTLF